MKESILIISAGESSWGMARTIRTMGYKVAIASNPGNDFIKSSADYYLETDENNVDAVVEFALKHHVVGVVPVPVDKILWWQAMVASRLGLPFIRPHNIPRFRNKFAMKEALQKAGIPCAKGVLLKPGCNLLYEIQELTFPLVVKPTDGYASRGVTKVDDFSSLSYFVNEAFAFSMDGDIVVEEFIEGREFNAEGVCSKGRVSFHAIIEKVSGAFPRTLEMGHIIPADITKDEEMEILNTVERAVHALELDDGGFNTEIKLNKGKGFIVEVNGRLAGDFIVSHLLKPTTGRDMEADVVNISAGKEIQFSPLVYKHHGFISFFNLPEHKKIIKINSLDELNTDPDIIWWKIFFREGEITPEIKHMGNRAGFVIVRGNTREGVIKKAENTLKKMEKAIILE